MAAAPRRATLVRQQVRCMVSTQQNQAQRDAEKRWETQVRVGNIKNVSTADAASLMKDGWCLLDVRPPDETAKVSVEGAVRVPLFVPDPDNSVAGLVKKATAFGMGGWWLGGTHYIPNADFMAEVQAQVPKDAGVVVACQKGLRSLAACEQLALAGYQKLAWINGGFDTSAPGQLPTLDGQDLRYAGIGGLSKVLGWTEVQQDDKPRETPLLIKLAAVVLVVDLLVFAYEQVNYMFGQQ